VPETRRPGVGSAGPKLNDTTSECRLVTTPIIARQVTGSVFTLRLRDEAGGIIRHLRAVLKTLLRWHGVRCLDCVEGGAP
jgi:hypothetical protein